MKRIILMAVVMSVGNSYGGIELPKLPAITKKGKLFNAVRDGDINKVKQLLDEGVDINVKNIRGTTPLMIAAQNGMVAMVMELLSRGADVTLKSYYGTALSLAKEGRKAWAYKASIAGGYDSIIKLLEDAEKKQQK